MTISDQIRSALDGITVGFEYFIPCPNRHSGKCMAKKEAKTLGISINVKFVQGGIIIKRIEP